MDFKDLIYFVTVAKEQNFSHASEKLYVTQPTLSQTIVRLEKRVGYPLFYRGQHGLSLTDEGEIFAETARKILQLKDELDAEMRGITGGQSGRIYFGISHFFSNCLLPRALPEFHRQYPDVEIIIHTETSSVLERMLLDGELDVAVMVETAPNDKLDLQVLFYEQVLLAVSPENPLANGRDFHGGDEYPYLAPELLQGQSFILSQEKMRLRQSAEAFFMAENISHKVAVTTASVETANRLAAYNEGIAFIPATYAAAIDSPPKPVYFVTSDSLKDWTVGIAWLKHNKKNPLVESFVQIFKESI